MAYLVRTLPALAFSTVCSILALTVSSNSASALTINSTVPQSRFGGFITTPSPLTKLESPYDFNGQTFGSLASIDSLTVTLTVNDGDTGPSPDNWDVDNLSLGLDGFDTEITLNGFSNGPSNHLIVTLPITGMPSNSAAILAALQTDGQLAGTIIRANRPGDNGIGIPGNFNTTLAVTGTAVPFEFSPGVGILALGALGTMAQLKSKMKNRKPLQLGSLSGNDE